MTVVVAAIGLAAPSGVAAQTPDPPCDPAAEPAARFSGLPAQIIHGREEVFGITAIYPDSGALAWSDYNITMSEDGVPFFTGTVDQYSSENELSIQSEPGDGPFAVSASYAEYVTSTGDSCTRVLSATVTGVRGERMPRLRVGARYEEGRFLITVPRGCTRRYATDSVAVSVKPKRLGRWVTITATDQCSGWRGRRSGRRFELRTRPYDESELLFVPRTARRDGVEDFRFRIRRALVEDGEVAGFGRTLRRGVLRVKTTHYPAERVYAFNGDQFNDRYWNYCVTKGKQVWMDDGNPYCVDPALTYRAVRLHR